MQVSVLFPYRMKLDGSNGGGANATLALLQEVAQHGHRVTVYIPDDMPRETVCNLIEFRWFVLSTEKIIVKDELFVFVLFDDKRALLAQFSLSKSTKRAILYHNAVFDLTNKDLLRFYKKWPDVFFVVSQYPANLAMKLGITPVCILHNGVAPVFRSVVPKLRVALTPDFIFVGALVKEKGFLYLIPAFQRLMSHYPNARLKIIGSSSMWDREKPDFEVLEHENIEFLGELTQDKIAPLYQKSTFVVLPSEMEACPLSILDGMWFGCVPIVSNRGGLPEIVENGKTGFVLPELSTNALYEAFIKALSLSVVQYRAMQENIINSVAKSDWSQAAATLELIKQKTRGLSCLWLL